MEAALNLIKRLQGALNINKLIYEVISEDRELREQILDLNRYGQLYNSGIDSTGEKLSDIGGEYSPVTLQFAAEKGRPKKSADHIDLYDTGRFYETFRLLLEEDGFIIDANTLKEDTDLAKEWGEDILGLTPESIEIVSSWLRDRIVKKIQEKINSA